MASFDANQGSDLSLARECASHRRWSASLEGPTAQHGLHDLDLLQRRLVANPEAGAPEHTPTSTGHRRPPGARAISVWSCAAVWKCRSYQRAVNRARGTPTASR
ncbi:MAG: hypothetical protein R3C56_04325 [Pirellulaceae bacterium]